MALSVHGLCTHFLHIYIKRDFLKEKVKRWKTQIKQQQQQQQQIQNKNKQANKKIKLKKAAEFKFQN